MDRSAGPTAALVLIGGLLTAEEDAGGQFTCFSSLIVSTDRASPRGITGRGKGIAWPRHSSDRQEV